MTCQSQSLMGVTVPFYLRVVYKFSNEFFNEILFVCRYSFPKEKKVATFPSRPFPLCEHFREIQHFNSQFDKCEKYKVFFVVFGILNVLFVSSKAN